IATRSPTATSVTPGPASSTRPMPSWPGMNGGDGLTGQSPWAAWISVWQSPDVSTLTRTWPAVSSAARTRSTVSGPPNSCTTAARYACTRDSLACACGSVAAGWITLLDMPGSLGGDQSQRDHQYRRRASSVARTGAGAANYAPEADRSTGAPQYR